MLYQEYKPDGYISNFVKCFWTSETLENGAEHTILPDGYFDLIVETIDDKVYKVKLTGIWVKPVDVFTPKNTKIYAVRFKPLATELLGNIELKALFNTFVILPNSFLKLNILAIDNFANFCTYVSAYLLNQIELLAPICKKKIALFSKIYKKETFSVKELSAFAFWESRQINRYFNAQYGLSLKTYLNVVRCNSSYKSMVREEGKCYEFYFDQAHHIKEVKKYTGVSPSELMKNKNDRFLQLLTLKTS